MIKVGVVGLGMMGLTHLDAYRKHSKAKIAAICDSNPDVLAGKSQAAGNVEGQAQSGVADLVDVKRYSDFDQVLSDDDIDVVDICLPTHLHTQFGLAVLESGKHLIIEKPLGRTSEDARRLVEAAERAGGLSFVAQCMRFWPGWTWLKSAIDDRRFGPVLAATFRRVANHPGGPFYLDGDRCGGAALDLHIHDTDFVQFCFGMPKSVTSYGYSKLTNQPDHIVTRYEYDDVPLVVAEGSWVLADGFGFSMSYCVNFERATAVFDSAAGTPLTLFEPGHDRQAVEIPADMGYDLEIDYFLDCIEKKQKPTVVTLADALRSVEIVEAEVKSVQTGQPVAIV